LDIEIVISLSHLEIFYLQAFRLLFLGHNLLVSLRKRLKKLRKHSRNYESYFFLINKKIFWSMQFEIHCLGMVWKLQLFLLQRFLLFFRFILNHFHKLRENEGYFENICDFEVLWALVLISKNLLNLWFHIVNSSNNCRTQILFYLTLSVAAFWRCWNWEKS